MSANFIVHSNKFDFVSDQEVANSLREAGQKTVVFVEGYTDKIIYGIFYRNHLPKVSFIGVGGCDKVKTHLENIVEKLPSEKGYFGIIDRDFRTDLERTQEMNDLKYGGRLYIFLRYTLENYFIEKLVMVEFLKDESDNQPSLKSLDLDVATIERLILDTLEKLIPVMAGNWTLLDFHKDFLKNNVPCDETKVKKQLEAEFSTPIPAAVESKYEQHKATILQSCGDINELQKYIRGKNFLHHFGIAVKDAIKSQGKSAKVHLDLSQQKAQLARIVKQLRLPGELEDILKFVGVA